MSTERYRPPDDFISCIAVGGTCALFYGIVATGELLIPILGLAAFVYTIAKMAKKK
jgi:hypothetical protein